MTLIGILAGVLILGLIMVIHELGHFLAGRFFGFKIDQFSIFLGPVLFEKERKGIRYNIKAIPLGASVSFTGQESEVEGQANAADFDPKDPDLFENRPKWQRAIVIAMGPFLNFVTAFLVFSLLFAFKGTVIPQVGRVQEATLLAETGLEAGDRILALNGMRIVTPLDLTIAEMSHTEGEAWQLDYQKPDGSRQSLTVMPRKAAPRPMLGISYQETEDGRQIILSVHPDADQGEAGFMPGDQVLSIEGVPFSESERITELVTDSAGQSLDSLVKRNGQEVHLSIRPFMLETDVPLGIILTLSHKAGDVLSQGIRYPISVLRTTVRGIGMLFAGKIGVRDSFAGPIAIVSMATDTVKNSASFA
ncbi:MAG TPA: RIP metalloprotease RseP, partial [Clostridia bacterium]|nr:RIP metalloprotease RseP [Clostridia bacterium]